MDDRERYFSRPSKAEDAAARKAARRRKSDDDWQARVKADREKRKAEIDKLLEENDRTPWWDRG